MAFTVEEFVIEYGAFRMFMGDKRNTAEQVLDHWEHLLIIYVNIVDKDKDKVKTAEMAICGLQTELSYRIPYMLTKDLRNL